MGFYRKLPDGLHDLAARFRAVLDDFAARFHGVDGGPNAGRVRYPAFSIKAMGLSFAMTTSRVIVTSRTFF